MYAQSLSKQVVLFIGEQCLISIPLHHLSKGPYQGTPLRTLFVAAGLNSPAVSAGGVAEVEVADGPVRREGGPELFPFQNAQGPVMSVWLSQQRGCSQSADISTRGVSDPEDKYRSKDQTRNHQKS